MSQLPHAQPAFPQPWEGQVNAPASQASKAANILAKSATARKHLEESWIDQSFIVLAAVGLVFFAVISNAFAIMDICCEGCTYRGQSMTSPLAMFHLERNHLIGLYAGTALMTIISAVALTRYDLPRWATLLKFIPLVFAVVFIGVVLRKSGTIAKTIAYFYLIAGSMLAGLAVMYFINIGMRLPDYHWMPILYSVCLQSGITLAVASAMSLDS